jgi:hypothetical protein
LQKELPETNSHPPVLLRERERFLKHPDARFLLSSSQGEYSSKDEMEKWTYVARAQGVEKQVVRLFHRDGDYYITPIYRVEASSIVPLYWTFAGPPLFSGGVCWGVFSRYPSGLPAGAH